MYSLILLSVISLVLALALTPVLRDLFARWGVVDVPDGKRKTHTKPTPHMGGIPIILACLAAFGILLHTPLSGGNTVRAALPAVWPLLPAVGVVFAVGLIDDIRGLKPWQKLVGEVAASGVVIAAGVQITGVVGIHFPPVLGVIGTVVWLVACANAVNLIDGMDGLAAGIALLATLTMLIAALAQGNMALAFATAPLAGALLGFLPYNFNPASIFLGDSGSLTLGFLLGCYGVLWSQKSVTIIGMTAPLLTLAVPLADAGLAIVRRFLLQQPIFLADRGHIHHRLLAQGLKPRRVVLLLYGVAGMCAWMSLAVGLLHAHFVEPVLFLFVAGTFLAIHLLRYAEFGTARRMVLEGAFRRLLNARISLDAVERAVREADSVEQCWRHIAGAFVAFGFSSLEFRAGGRTFQASGADLLGNSLLADTGASNSGVGCSGTGRTGWQVRVELENGNHVVLRRATGMQNHITLAAGFIEMLEKTLPGKLAEFQAREETGEQSQAPEAGTA
jgi:UDP-GlcNAc:undecaprenyl-phosphate GlcNAc-1-phosphate transferase